MIAQSVYGLGYGLDDRSYRGLISGRGYEFFSSPSRLDRIWGAHSLLSNGCRGLSPRV